ncbi:hypothetical protein [Gallibacterium genomosp. 3]|uniref:hypothetical protein n=1 Tax=Gallibacterium genomosp. 3 TaxID=505345 RepID=UPI0014288E76|nr:hypothetical protein [Gallibacterium genomosp. 3]
MDSIKDISNVFKEIIIMSVKLTAWRFIAILITVVLCFVVWKTPEIILALGKVN